MPSRAFFLYLPPVIIVNTLQYIQFVVISKTKCRLFPQNVDYFLDHGQKTDA